MVSKRFVCLSITHFEIFHFFKIPLFFFSSEDLLFLMNLDTWHLWASTLRMMSSFKFQVWWVFTVFLSWRVRDTIKTKYFSWYYEKNVWIKGRKQSSGFLHIFTVAFLPFLALAGGGGGSPCGAHFLTLYGNH